MKYFPLILGMILLCFCFGYFVHKTQTRFSTRTTTTWVERPVFIAGKTETRTVHYPIPVPQPVGALDTLIAKSSIDSLKSLVRWYAAPVSEIFEDTLSVKDSLGAFFSRMITQVDLRLSEQNPLERIMTKGMKFMDSKLTTANTKTETTVETLSWTEATLCVLIGAVLTLLAVIGLS